MDPVSSDNSSKYWNSFLPIFFDRIGNVMRGYMADIVKDYGITSAHCTYLITLNIMDGPTSSQLSRYLDMDQGNTFRVIQKLTELGMVTSDKSNTKARNYRLYLTEYGKKIADEVMEKTTEFMDTGFNNVPEEDVLITRRTLVQILQNIDPSLDDYLDNSFTNPFFSYLNMMIPNEKDVQLVPRRLRDGGTVKYEKVSVSQKGSHAPTFIEPEKIVDNSIMMTFVILREKDHGYIFKIYEGDKRCVLTSGHFPDLDTCKECIESIKRDADSNIRDLTLQNPNLVLGSAYELTWLENSKFICHLIDADGNVLMESKEYSNKTICKRDIEKFRINLPFARVVQM